MTRTQTFGREKFVSLDLIRGVAAFIVALSHFNYGGLVLSPIAGPLCVGFFFLLSGYVLAHSYQDKIQSGEFSLRDFTVARLARLYPLQFVTFVLVAAYWMLVEVARLAGLPLRVENGNNLVHVFENLTLTHLLIDGAVSFNSPSWSIGVEFWGSLFIFALCMPISRWIKGVMLAVVAVAFLVVEMHGGFLHAATARVLGFLEKNYTFGFACFAIGWAIYGRSLPRMPIVGGGITSLVFILLLLPPAWLIEFPQTELVFIALFTLSIMLLAPAQPRSQFAAKVMETAGEMSYGIYLWHVPIMLGITTCARAIEIYTGASVLKSPVLVFIYVALLLPTAWLSFRYLEMPGKRLVKRLLTPSRTAPTR